MFIIAGAKLNRWNIYLLEFKPVCFHFDNKYLALPLHTKAKLQKVVVSRISFPVFTDLLLFQTNAILIKDFLPQFFNQIKKQANAISGHRNKMLYAWFSATLFSFYFCGKLFIEPNW